MCKWRKPAYYLIRTIRLVYRERNVFTDTLLRMRWFMRYNSHKESVTKVHFSNMRYESKQESRHNMVNGLLLNVFIKSYKMKRGSWSRNWLNKSYKLRLNQKCWHLFGVCNCISSLKISQIFRPQKCKAVDFLKLYLLLVTLVVYILYNVINHV